MCLRRNINTASLPNLVALLSSIVESKSEMQRSRRRQRPGENQNAGETPTYFRSRLDISFLYYLSFSVNDFLLRPAFPCVRVYINHLSLAIDSTDSTDTRITDRLLLRDRHRIRRTIAVHPFTCSLSHAIARITNLCELLIVRIISLPFYRNLILKDTLYFEY